MNVCPLVLVCLLSLAHHGHAPLSTLTALCRCYLPFHLFCTPPSLSLSSLLMLVLRLVSTLVWV